jgi:hypothetical protein
LNQRAVKSAQSSPFDLTFGTCISIVLYYGRGQSGTLNCLSTPTAMTLAMAVLAAATTSVWAELAIVGFTPNPAPIGKDVEFTAHFTGVEERHLSESMHQHNLEIACATACRTPTPRFPPCGPLQDRCCAPRCCDNLCQNSLSDRSGLLLGTVRLRSAHMVAGRSALSSTTRVFQLCPCGFSCCAQPRVHQTVSGDPLVPPRGRINPILRHCCTHMALIVRAH